MQEEWLKGYFKKRRRSPNDSFQYFIAQPIVTFTDQILKDYGRQKGGCEGLVYWAGIAVGNDHWITAAYAPRIKSFWGGFVTTHTANASFVDFVSNYGLRYLCQVHSHPSKCVNHSKTDDEKSAFRREGLISIVVPNYAQRGLMPLPTCGIHRFAGDTFLRLSDKYIQGHFHTVENTTHKIITQDGRNE